MTSVFLENLTSSCLRDSTGNWTKLSQFFFGSIPYKYLESCLLNVIKSSSSYRDVFVLLGDLVLQNTNYQYLLFDKFLFVKILNNENSIQNLIGYLCSFESDRELYYEVWVFDNFNRFNLTIFLLNLKVFRKLLNAWSTQTSIVNTSYDQHLYLTKCIIICLAFSDTGDKAILSTG